MASSEDGSTDVFVSYSRSDQEFVRELVAALAAREKRAWVDWEGIPPTAEWLAEIHSAIEASDALLFVISRASLASRMCREELAHAEKLGKRIVPVDIGGVDPDALPPVLAERQWITFADSRPFETSIDVLVAALDTDLDWVRQHTQWLAKAREWERQERDRSFLLRGSELRAAESWLTTPGAAEKEPAPTPLQNEYVLASRQAAARRQRAVVAVAIVGLLVMSALAVAAIVQRDRAIEQRKTAVSELLASVSRERLEARLDTALLLAVAAYDVKETAAARDAVVAGVQRTEGVRSFLRLGRLRTGAVAFSGDGRAIATATAEGVSVHDLATGSLVASLAVAEPRALALNRDGSRLATVTDGRAAVHAVFPGRIGSGAPVAGVERAWSVAFAPRAARLAIGTSDGHVVLHDLVAKRSTTIRTSPPPGLDQPITLHALAFDPDETSLAAASPVGPYVVDLVRQRAELMPQSEFVTALAFAARRSLLVITGGGRLTALDPSTGRTSCTAPARALSAVAVVSGRIIVSGRDGSVRISTRPCGAAERVLEGHSGAVPWLGPGPGSAHVVSVDESGLAVVWGQRGMSLVRSRRTPMPIAADVIHGARGPEVLVGGEAGVVRIREGHEATRLQGAPAGVLMLAAAREQPVFAAAARPAALWVGPRYRRVRLAAAPPAVSAALGADGRILALGRPGGVVEIWDVRRRSRLRRLATGTRGSPTALAISPSGRIAAGDNDGRLVAWDDLGSARTVLRQSGPGTVEAAAFAPDGEVLAAASANTIVIWDLERETMRELPALHVEPVTDLAFAPPGDRLVSGDAAGTLRVWDVAAARALGHAFRLSAEAIAGVDVDNETGAVAAVGDTGTAFRVDSSIWDVDAARRRICALVGRGLTDEEWSAAAGGLPRPAGC